MTALYYAWTAGGGIAATGQLRTYYHERPLIGRSCRWRFEPTTSAIDSLPDVGLEILPNANFLIPSAAGPDWLRGFTLLKQLDMAIILLKI